MADKKETADAAPKKKGKMKTILIGGVALLVLVGGGVGAGVYASNAGLLGGGHAAAADDGKPKLVPKSEQKHPTEGGEGGGHGGDEAAPENHGMKPPAGEGGDKYASTYYPMEKEFTSNLQDSSHFVQVGIAVATPYDDTVITNLKTNDIAVRSAILMALGDTTEEQVMSSDGKRQLQVRLAKAINDTLKQKEGFGGIGNVYFTSFVVQ
ncbi:MULTISPECIES: flagellar basal body-associated FliL family protein [unclassified Sphingomonas]|jgi:flagellar FliL protein|uniref:flagellar basal body-associated FliL family protein n=1 Tax=unclassified Sphingomonas TaxID=196159 RepID=UPI000700A371|nr:MULTISPECIES: flagellar basal body-associated FliL family protein [unclassified Sphingomonas]KQS48300.1 flagellar basal body protein FliL [Sphingomonas sp. Leaf198]